MTVEQVRALLERVAYFPGWMLSVGEDREGIFLVAEATVPDSYRPTTTVDLRIVSFLPPCALVDEEAVMAFIDWRLARIALHEHMEWLRLDGKPWRDPHAAER